MKNLNQTILIALGMALSPGVMASPDGDITIRMMEENEQTTDAVTRHIELPAATAERATEHADEGLAAANRNRNRNRNGDQEMEREMEREEAHQREMDRNDRKDVEHEGMDRKEAEQKGFGYGGDMSQP